MNVNLARPKDNVATITYKKRLWKLISVIPWLMGGFGTALWLLDCRMYATAMWIYGGFFLSIMILLIITKKYATLLAAVSLYFTAIFAHAIAILFGGILHSGGVVFVGLAAATLSLSFLSRIHSHILLMMFLFLLIADALFQSYIPAIEALPPYLNLILFVLHVWVIAINIYKTLVQYIEERIKLKSLEASRLQEMDNLKTQFYTNITHEFRTPLTVILGMVEQIAQKPKSYLQTGVSIIRNNCHRLLRLVNQMMDLSKLESGNLELHPINYDFIRYLKYILETYKSIASHKDITLDLQVSIPELIMDFDPDRMESILENILTNALKNTYKGTKIVINLTVLEPGMSKPNHQFHLFPDTEICDLKRYLHISIKDQGPGIRNEHLQQIFERYFRIEEPTVSSAGTGIGLSLVKELLHRMQGQLYINTTPGNGSEFILVFPITCIAPVKEVYQSNPDNIFKNKSVPFPPKNISELQEDRQMLLVIDDNKDLIHYITTVLTPMYNIVAAENGIQGISLALELLPDLILSDVMMPVKDGFEVCKTLKNDFRTSHIPIILLTAKADMKSKITGWESGADAYLMKPFNSEELLTRIEKLLESRDKLKERYRKVTIVQSDQPLPKDPNADFIQKFKQVLEVHLDDDKFDTYKLAKLLHISRAQLYRKLQALTGQSASQLIRSIRMNRARDLIVKTNLNMAQIAYQVGFADPSNFSKTFVREFGITPTNYRKKVSKLQR